MPIKKPTPVDLMTYMIQRRQIAIDLQAADERRGNTGQALVNQTVAVEMSQMLAYVSGDQYWSITAQQDVQGLKAKATKIDAQSLEPVRLGVAA